MRTLFVGRNIIRLDRIGSTNNYTVAALRQSVMPEGTVVLAAEQFAGRGQRGNTWVSSPGDNLTFSLVLYPTFLPVRAAFDLNRLVSLAVRDLVAQLTGQSVTIKWPNDILVDGVKIAGLLIENTLRGGLLASSVVGIGLNVNQLDFPPAIKATSVRLLTDKRMGIEEVLRQLCSLLEGRYLQLKGGNPAAYEDYHGHLFGLDEWRTFSIADQPELGRIIGVDEGGLLQLEQKNGTVRCFNFQEVGYSL